MALSREQQELAQRALRRARQRGATARVQKALLLAGLTESQLQHDRYRQVGSGDRDSVGFLQQRPSQGWGPAGESVEQDTDQFLDRALRLNKGFRGSAGQLAQAVQRSAFPERYDQRSGEAEAILRRFGGGGASRPVSSSGPVPDARAVVAPEQSNGAQLAAVLLSAQQQKQPRPSMGLALPAAAAGPVMPVGAQQVMWQAPRESPGAALAQAMTAIKGLGGVEAGEAPEVAADAPDAAPVDRGGKAVPLRPGGGYAGTKGIASSLASIGRDLGLEVTSEKRHNTNPHSGKNSDHDHGNKDAYAYDISSGGAPNESMDRTAYRIMRRLGFKDYEMGQPIDTQRGVKTIRTKQGTYRVQVIYRGTGAAFGGNHLNHVHIGVKRIGR